ncbi:MAG TPA: hypothetical protein VN645_12225 [Steroidobacteraceae bacterium]|nr:hypothetical protein [Steroidobacteraceae bacterium]
MKIRFLLSTAALTCLTAAAMAQNAAPAAAAPAGRTPGGGLTGSRLDELAQKHPGFLGALAPQNLAKKRPKAPFDLTGTWFVDLTRSFADFRFGPPYPEFFEPGQTALREAEEYRKAGKPYRDTIGRCFPAGMPMIMTRVWPTSMVQLPTVIYQLFSFTSSMRFIYLDGRAFTDPDVVSYTYNGESIGKWEGNALVVKTKYIEPKDHYIDAGIPISDQFEITERYTLSKDGMLLNVDYTMTDPKMWKGEWKSHKGFLRQDYSDIPEAECLPNLNENLPSTPEGQKAIEDRAKTGK